jgi:hypothetical protein
VGLLLAAAAACDSRPRAPALVDNAVYQNEREGLRFLVPDGWLQQGRSELPAGPIDRERMLVLYRQPDAGPPSSLGLTVVDIGAGADLGKHVVEASGTAPPWKLIDKQEARVGSRPAERYRLSARAPEGELRREVVAVRKGGRVYFFTGTWGANDTASPEQVRRTLDAVLWKD